MSNAWEVSDDDIRTVYGRHSRTPVSDERIDEIARHVYGQADRVEDAALRFDDFDRQAESALDEIEDILIEEGVLKGPKVFGLRQIVRM